MSTTTATVMPAAALAAMMAVGAAAT